MSHADVASTVSEFVPCVHMEWSNDSAPDLPWATYHGEDRPVSAGDEQIAVIHRWTVELYEKRRDAKLEEDLSNALRAKFGSIRREESWIENDNMLMVAFSFRQIEGNFDG